MVQDAVCSHPSVESIRTGELEHLLYLSDGWFCGLIGIFHLWARTGKLDVIQKCKKDNVSYVRKCISKSRSENGTDT